MYDYCSDGWRLTFETMNNQSTGIKQNAGSYLASRYVGEAMDSGGLQEFPHQVHLDLTCVRILVYRGSCGGMVLQEPWMIEIDMFK